jgi:quinol monooxygenase YgiN
MFRKPNDDPYPRRVRQGPEIRAGPGGVGEKEPMILVDARCSILPERKEEFIRNVQMIVPRVREEAGCSRYELVADTGASGIFHFLEVWESQSHLDKHIAQPHMREYFAKTAACHAVPVTLTIYEILSSRSVTLQE